MREFLCLTEKTVVAHSFLFRRSVAETFNGAASMQEQRAEIEALDRNGFMGGRE